MPLRGKSNPAPASQPICGGCGAPLVGSYIRALGADWHPEHFLCGGCGLPIGGAGFAEAAGVAYHPHCHANLFAPKCFYCGVPMTGAYVRDPWGAEFCKHHSDRWPKCKFCGRLVDGSTLAGRATEGGLQCSLCTATAVDAPEAAATLYRQAMEWTASQSLPFPAVPLELTDMATLISSSSEPKGNRTLGTTRISTTTLDGAPVKVEVLRIEILRGLPGTLFSAVAAHEAGHAWLRHSGVESLSAAEEEGFCELLAHTWLRESPSPERDFFAQQIANNEDAVYGDGFRQVSALAAIHGLPALVDSLRKNKRFPVKPPWNRRLAFWSPRTG